MNLANGRYVLDSDGNPRLEPDLLTWAMWLEHAQRQIAYTELPQGVKVSTIFIGLDYGWDEAGPPVLWETMAFDGPFPQKMNRYTSRELALAGHEAMVEEVKRSMAGQKEGECS
jgi:hypothetical protein